MKSLAYAIYGLILLGLLWLTAKVCFGLSLLALMLLLPLTSVAMGQQPNLDGTQAMRDLGHIMFFDKRLSDGTTSCADCHNPAMGWTDKRPKAVGRIGSMIDGEFRPDGVTGVRRSTPILNVCLIENMKSSLMFVDGRAKDPFEQCIGPIANPDEMSNQTPQQMVNRVSRLVDYQNRIRAAFGTTTMSVPQYQAAMVSFERQIKAVDTPLGRYLAGDKHALSASEKRGADLFVSVGCVTCHPAPYFTTGLFANTGIEARFRQQKEDIGLQKTTKDPKDRGAFKIPGLVNVSQRGPLTHKGDIPSIHAMLVHYNAGGRFLRNGEERRDKNLHPLIKPLKLSKEQFDDLENCVENLTLAYDTPKIEAPREFPR
jgi:cytochrome c peroxidase